MKKLQVKRIAWITAGLFLLIACKTQKEDNQKLKLGTFGAFYTKIESGEEFEKFSRTGEYADVVVDLGTGTSKFVFWRGSCYLPYLETDKGQWFVDEMIQRKGNGTEIMPDRINTYSHVEIIQSNEEKVVVHWRYLPEFSGINPHSGVESTKFVDEYFSVTRNLEVTRTIRKGTIKIDQWKDSTNKIRQTFKLTNRGIAELKTMEAVESAKIPKITGSEPITSTVKTPVAWWKLDEGNGDFTTETYKEVKSEIIGHKSLWKKGMSGTALAFDGYNSLITLPFENSPDFTNKISLEAWITIGAYPWNWAPIIQQGDDNGYYLGVSGLGNPGFKIMAGRVWEELESEIFLERNTWYHLVGSYDGAEGIMKIYVDGTEAGSKKVGKGNIVKPNAPVKIGKGKEMRPINPVRKETFVDSYGFDGLIDEIKIYDISLTRNEVAEAFKLYDQNLAQKTKPDMEYRTLPKFDGHGRFGASYTRLNFYETWDNLWRFSDHADVVVTFDLLPTQFVFWRGTGYIPMMVNEKGQWYSNEFNETWGTSGGQGCQEPMSDKTVYYNHARIIENTNARVVVHWRYPLADVLHVFANVDTTTAWGDWADWYFYIYPDGVAAKKMILWTHGERNHEWQESMGIFGPNQHPEDVIETKAALTMVNLEGEYKEYSWESGPPENINEPDDQVIQQVNYKADYDPVTIGNFYRSDVYGGEVTPYSVFPTWNHWPVAQMPSDGRYASFPDRTAHSSLTHVRLPTDAEDYGDLPFQQKLLMEAMLNKDPKDLIPLAASWLNPPQVVAVTGCNNQGYDRSQRAFVIDATENKMSLIVKAFSESPLVNPCFVIKNWGKNSNADISVDGKAMPAGSDVRQGIIRDTDGSWTLIVWFKLEAEKSVEFSFNK